MEYAENIVQLLANLAALLLCLFRYVSNKRRGWLFAVVFFLCSLLSSYYWTTYFIITGDWPHVSGSLAYAGWNCSYFILYVLLIYMKAPEERRFFHPLMLLPVPLNVWQLTVYLPYGQLLNNIYQVLIGTLLMSFSIQGMCWYRKKRKDGAARPYIALAVFLFILLEFGMWTSSCMDEPFAGLYYPFSFLCSGSYFLLFGAISKTYSDEGKASVTTFDRKYQNILKAASAAVVLVCSVGGIMLGMWIRNRMMEQGGDIAPRMNDIIPLVLFVISLVLEFFCVAVVFVVYFGQRATENNKLREARQVAERSSALKSEFLANMSHEIRTPINAVMGMNEIIMRESRHARDDLPVSGERVREIFSDINGCAGVIDIAGKNLLAIINDILDISKIEAGRLEIREGNYRLSSMLNDVCNLIGFRAQSRGLSFRVQVDEELPDHLFGDELRVRQIILNLLSNAVKYTRSGSVTLIVSGDTSREREAGRTVFLTVSVRDTGVGIRPEDLNRLFDKFERLSLAENSNVEGTGLGLAICKNLLDMMGGSIDVESTYGAGSVFTVRLPQRIVSGEAIGNFKSRFEHSAETRSLSSELFRAPEARILIVDDTRMNLIVAAGLLRNTKIQIDTALGGDEAIRLCRSKPYDLILMDQRMPVMDGTEALRRIREQEDGANRNTPVVCLTADAVSGAKERYLAEGFTDYLSKPIDSRALQALLIRRLPPEKVVLLETSEAEHPREETPEGRYAALRAAGIDPARGLASCQEDAELYRTVLREYGKSGAEKAEQLQRFYEEGQWKDYSILVHAVKSSSATVGAERLAEEAAKMEAAAKAEDTEVLRGGHGPLLAEYRRAAQAAAGFCGNGPEAAEDGDVMEFEPDPPEGSA